MVERRGTSPKSRPLTDNQWLIIKNRFFHRRDTLAERVLSSWAVFGGMGSMGARAHEPIVLNSASIYSAAERRSLDAPAESFPMNHTSSWLKPSWTRCWESWAVKIT